MRCSAPGSGFFAPDGAGCLRRCISNAPKVRVVSDGPFFSVLPEKRRFQPRFLSRMRKKAPLTVERKNSQGGVASEQTPHPSSCPPQAADRPRPFRCSSFSHTNRFAGFAWEPCPFANPLKTTKEEAIPLPWNHHPSEYRRWRNSIRQIFNGRKRNKSH